MNQLSFQRRLGEQRGFPPCHATLAASATVDHSTHPNLTTTQLFEQVNCAQIVTEQAGKSVDYQS
jgi:hypothetical protein